VQFTLGKIEKRKDWIYEIIYYDSAGICSSIGIGERQMGGRIIKMEI
jgi:hypothetical protein